ncbi:MAG: hypothetical protein JO328_21650 [Hyphomicrobiales bacterium]|nr:hypothetical protein [Hyphomicrobiales bacterium]
MSFSELIFSDSPTILFGRMVALCGMIFLGGRAAVDLFRTYAIRSKAGESALTNPNYVSVAFGPTLLLFITWALKVADLYSFGAVLIFLASIIVLAVPLSRRFRDFILHPWRDVDALAVAYLAGALAFWVMLGADEHPNLRDSANYMLQGFNLFFSRYAADLPHYGLTFIAPIMYVGHTMSALFAILSYGNHFAYYAYGLYWLNVLIGPVIPIGAYLLFRRFAPQWLALAIAGFFCWYCLSYKIWSLRGESLAWIIGFAFLMVLADIVSALKETASARSALRLSPLLAPLFFAMILTHGVTSFIVAVFSVGYVAASLAQQWQRSQVFLVARVAALSLLPLLLLFAAFAYTYTGTLSPLERTAQWPPPGDIDAAVQYDNAWIGAPLDAGAPRVLSSPPYIARKTIAEITAFVPLGAAFREGITSFKLANFPANAVERLHRLPGSEKWTYALLLVFSIILYLSPFAAGADPRRRTLFWASVTVYFAIILFSVYLDSQSVSLYPLASIRRTFVYVTFFYWLAIGLAALDFIVRPIFAFYSSALAKTSHRPGRLCRLHVAIWSSAWAVRLRGSHLAVAALVPVWFAVSIGSLMEKPVSGGYFLHRAAQRIKADFGHNPADRSSIEIVGARLKPLFDAIAFIQAHTSPGEWIFSNVSSSENAFWFLSSGRYSLMEGASIYQLYFMQKAAAVRMHNFASFALTADVKSLSPFAPRYLLLYKGGDCAGIECYGDKVIPTNLGAFDNNPSLHRVFENEAYRIFERSEAAPSQADATMDTGAAVKPPRQIGRLVRLRSPDDDAAQAGQGVPRNPFSASILAMGVVNWIRW